ncbi:ribonuclease H [Senna tora]|uniref:Ribonuclease H n=1 Tax=Senna tora TaxID=362788 RepID=A0A834SR37_9FABA|nr:ribonuclease H [Senna tora]
MDGEWLSEDTDLKSYVKDFFLKLFSQDMQNCEPLMTNCAFPEVDVERLGNQINEEEIRCSLFAMKGIHGFLALFFQRNWNVVKNSVCHVISGILAGTSNVAEINQSLIVLIPKVQKPEFVNVIYKCLSKCLDRFCCSSGQTVNNNKTRIFFSKNIGAAVMKNIVDAPGFMKTEDLEPSSDMEEELSFYGW